MSTQAKPTSNNPPREAPLPGTVVSGGSASEVDKEIASIDLAGIASADRRQEITRFLSGVFCGTDTQRFKEVRKVYSPNSLCEAYQRGQLAQAAWLDISGSEDFRDLDPQVFLESLINCRFFSVGSTDARFQLAGWLMQLTLVEGEDYLLFQVGQTQKEDEFFSPTELPLPTLSSDTAGASCKTIIPRFPILARQPSKLTGEWRPVSTEGPSSEGSDDNRSILSCVYQVPVAEASSIRLGVSGNFRVLLYRVNGAEEELVYKGDLSQTKRSIAKISIGETGLGGLKKGSKLKGGDLVRLELQALEADTASSSSEVLALSRPDWPIISGAGEGRVLTSKADFWVSVLFASSGQLNLQRYQALLRRGIGMLRDGDFRRFINALKTRVPELFRLLSNRIGSKN